MKRLIFFILLFLSSTINAFSVKYSAKDLYGDWHCQIVHKNHNAKILADYRLYKNGKVHILSMLRFPEKFYLHYSFPGMLHYSYQIEGDWKLDKNSIIMTIDKVFNFKPEHGFISEYGSELWQHEKNFSEKIQNKSLYGVTDKLVIQIKSFEDEKGKNTALIISNDITEGFCTRIS